MITELDTKNRFSLPALLCIVERNGLFRLFLCSFDPINILSHSSVHFLVLYHFLILYFNFFSCNKSSCWLTINFLMLVSVTIILYMKHQYFSFYQVLSLPSSIRHLVVHLFFNHNRFDIKCNITTSEVMLSIYIIKRGSI